MFTEANREALRAALLALAEQDGRLSGGAITGSGAGGKLDRWSDIDLAFGVADGAERDAVVAAFTEYLYGQHGALHHHDIAAGPWLYRVFFLPGCLQVDLAFVEGQQFRPRAETFRLVFGRAGEMDPFPEPGAVELIGLAWLHGLHVRSSVGRGKLWQGEYMLRHMRDLVLTLACLRHGLPAAHGRGFDALPEAVTGPLVESLTGRLEAGELWKGLRVVAAALEREIGHAAPEMAGRVEAEMRELAEAPKELS